VNATGTADTPSDETLATLRAWVEDRRQDMLDDLRDYVTCETPSDDLDALARGLAWVRDWLVTRLGEPASEQRHPGGTYGDTMVLDYPGTGHCAGAGFVTMLAHYDTVWPLGTLQEIPFTVESDTIRGPGVFDMKAGLVQAVWAVTGLDELGVGRPPLRWVLNGDEELGSPSSRRVIEDACRKAQAVLVFEASAEGAVKTARKGVGLFDVYLSGVEAHAGLDPTAGASAITALAELIDHVDQGQDPAAGTTINIGLVQGGTRRNVTAGSAHAGIDVRVTDPAEQDRVDHLLSEWTPSNPRVAVKVTGGWNRPVMTRTPEIATLFTDARTVAQRLGVRLQETAVGGASDGNFAAALGLPVLDGFGAVGSGAHARSEFATVSGMVQRTALAAGVLALLGHRNRPAAEAP
jgi:glutamate carboxypeptidase